MDFKIPFLRKLCLGLFALGLTAPLCAQTPADSIDVLHYGVYLDTIVNTTAVKRLYAHTQVTLTPTQPALSYIQLDLMQLQVDSVKVNGNWVSHTHVSPALRFSAPAGVQPGDTVRVEVWYQGLPHKDAGFGGVYFSGNNVFNIGVGFNANPVNLGRTWIPSNDNFTDRAYYDFHVRTGTGLMAACSGSLDSVSTHPDGSKTWHWNLRDNIPVYLAGFSVAPYLKLEDAYISITGDTIPFEIYGVAGDTTNAKNQSINLKAGMTAFEQRFGPYRWERLGFVIVALPTTGVLGAMEHATNIVYPRIFLTQGQSFETIWAHEAAHGWFGNLVTCQEEGQMWLNEGWASYCESIFEEAIYGFQTYKDYQRSTHADVLRRAHIEEGGYQPLSGIPHAYVYGRTVYSKGATIAHTLRGQMGDALFFPAIRDYLDAYAFRHSHTDSLEQYLEGHSGMELTPFFDGWVRQGGAPHFRIDSFTVTMPMPYLVRVYTRQSLRGATALVDSAHVVIRFTGAGLETQDFNVTMSGARDTFTMLLPFIPVSAALDPEEWMADATTDNYKFVTGIANQPFPQTWCSVLCDSVSDTTYLRVVHNWVAPDPLGVPLPGITLAATRYWTVEGTFHAGFRGRGVFTYNGSTNANTGLLDNTWMGTVPEDSLVLLYREGSGHNWGLAAGQQGLFGSPADKTGTIVVPLKAGEYTLAYRSGAVAAAEAAMPLEMQVWPNPNDGSFHVQLETGIGKYRLVLHDAQGRVVKGFEGLDGGMDLQLQGLPAGVYTLQLVTDTGLGATEKIVVQH